MSVLLDTNVVSAVVAGESEASRRLLALDPRTVAIPQVVVAELHYGVARLRPSRRRTVLEHRLALLLGSVGRAPWNDRVSERFGHLKADLEARGQRLDDFDVAIAAHALATDSALVTRNARHFARIEELRIEDWSSR